MIPSNETVADRVVLDAVRVALDALPEASTIAIAYSGGLDSSVLLDATVRVAGAARCVALHVHHGLSPNADAWLAHAEASAAALGVSFDAQRVEVPRDSGLGVEASAREVRYRALDALGERHGAQALWVAQHADDQAETVLLQLLRGAGLAGIAAMAPRYLPDGATIVRMRPLLSLLRAQLERYAEARALHWIDDESNADTRYTRNALRAQVLPELAVHFPGFRDALARTAQHAAAAQRLLDVLAADDLAGVARDDGRVLSRERLLGFDDERGANLLRHWMRTLGLPGASAARLAEMIKQLRATQVSHALRIDHAGQCLRLYRDDVYWEPGDSADPPDDGSARARPVARLEWTGQEVWHLPAWRGSFVFRSVGDAAEAAAGSGAEDVIAEAVLAGSPLVVRARAGGERMRMAADGPSRTLKNLFQERGVPAWQRDVPLLHAGETLLFVPRLGVNRAPEAGGMVSGGIGPCRRVEWRPDLLIA
ncbi:tRNA lysidine(34) synthetase TilS [Burkholderia plantarii]|uniref:tRNA lysidine(34) synthetase TilS n=1 Tax=Burkholderia plantarii TaxID=41899 RepID=UPI0018DD534C|nr:tRNA lysidine(34) synthetase TilS [Burkholderia plantarii]MBI0328002.1 tRNA lysidine(34) synthetase TilS [Burkholderia plantarii]